MTESDVNNYEIKSRDDIIRIKADKVVDNGNMLYVYRKNEVVFCFKNWDYYKKIDDRKKITL